MNGCKEEVGESILLLGGRGQLEEFRVFSNLGGKSRV
jgi:hypothetical protein